MSEEPKLNHPWLVAVWPGMGHVAVTAGYYLMAKLEMLQAAEFSPRELFDVEHVNVTEGLIRPSPLPRSRFFTAHNTDWKHDLVLFISEAQPSQGKYAFCQRLLEYAMTLGVERVFTFAAMASPMRPDHSSRVFAAATEMDGLSELQRLELEILKEGNISGLNGVLLGVASDCSLRGACLLGEIPHMFAHFPFPKASLEVLEAFTTLAGIDVDLDELRAQADAVDRKLSDVLAQVEQAVQQDRSEREAGSEEPLFSTEHETLAPTDRRLIERLFEQALQDRSRAYELKRELDRLNVFAEYEDRFLDLFKPSN